MSRTTDPRIDAARDMYAGVVVGRAGALADRYGYDGLRRLLHEDPAVRALVAPIANDILCRLCPCPRDLGQGYREHEEMAAEMLLRLVVERLLDGQTWDQRPEMGVGA